MVLSAYKLSSSRAAVTSSKVVPLDEVLASIVWTTEPIGIHLLLGKAVQ